MFVGTLEECTNKYVKVNSSFGVALTIVSQAIVDLS